MKLTVGVLAVLLILTAVVVGQESQSPFPMAANPALATNTSAGEPSPSAVYRRQVLPSAMASNQSSMIMELPPTAKAEIYTESPLSPFPMYANPALASGSSTTAETPIVEQRDRVDNDSPFPKAADPSRPNR